MAKKYVDDINLQIAMTEYNKNMRINSRVRTENKVTVGRVGQVYDNEHGSGEQVFVVIRLSHLTYVIL